MMQTVWDICKRIVLSDITYIVVFTFGILYYSYLLTQELTFDHRVRNVISLMIFSLCLGGKLREKLS